MSALTAQDLKRGGVTAIQRAIRQDGEAVITVHGKQLYVVLNIDSYNRIRELELEGALLEAREDIQAKRYVAESVEKHMKRVRP